MKRGVAPALALGLTMLWARPALGQRGGVTLGAIFGYSRADLAGADAQNVDSRTSTLAGAFIRIPVADWFSLQPEVLFSRKGGTTTTSIPAAPTATALDFEFVYIELPVLFRFTVPVSKVVRPLAFGGPVLGFDIGCDVNTDQSSSVTRGTCQDLGLQPTSMDVSVMAGAGVDIKVGNSSLGLEVRYTWGLRQVFQNVVDIKNRQFGLLLEVPF